MFKCVTTKVTKVTLENIILNGDCYMLTVWFDEDLFVDHIEAHKVRYFETGDAESGPSLEMQLVRVQAEFDGIYDKRLETVLHGGTLTDDQAAALLKGFMRYAEIKNNARK